MEPKAIPLSFNWKMKQWHSVSMFFFSQIASKWFRTFFGRHFLTQRASSFKKNCLLCCFQFWIRNNVTEIVYLACWWNADGYSMDTQRRCTTYNMFPSPLWGFFFRKNTIVCMNIFNECIIMISINFILCCSFFIIVNHNQFDWLPTQYLCVKIKNIFSSTFLQISMCCSIRNLCRWIPVSFPHKYCLLKFRWLANQLTMWNQHGIVFQLFFYICSWWNARGYN